TPTVWANDGAGSSLDADLLDGQHASNFALASHNHWGMTWSGSGTGLTLSGGNTGLSSSGSDYGISASGNTAIYGNGSGTGVSGVTGYGDGFGVIGTNTNSSGGVGVYGSGATYGVFGANGSTGVYGSGSTQGVYGTGNGFGVYGTSSNGGVYGTGTNYGVMGSSSDTGVYGSGYSGVRGNSTVSGGPGIYGAAYNLSGDYAGYFSGNVRVNGNFSVSGSKSAVVDTKDYGSRTLYAVESPENWFEDFGTGQLTNGEAVITIDPVFAETVNLTDDYHVFLTPLGDCALYVDEKSPTSFTVRAMGGQTCSIAFDYRIVAKRLGYEDVRLAEVDTSSTVELPDEGLK
ncbi:MAG TPA: hypothetical protein VLG46_14535, partial [Anaerolineae bacterium]|nr:hypothetical protein [Anaerolineae bacterium]